MPDNADSALVDANIFLRYLTEDLPEQAEKARDLLERAERGEEELVTTTLTIAEIVWVLESVYELDRTSIRAKVVAILGLPGLTVEDQEVLLQAVVWYGRKERRLCRLLQGGVDRAPRPRRGVHVRSGLRPI